MCVHIYIYIYIHIYIYIVDNNIYCKGWVLERRKNTVRAKRSYIDRSRPGTRPVLYSHRLPNGVRTKRLFLQK